jgi:hypothetical protein
MRWRDDARRQGQLLPAADRGPEGWSSRDKFAAVVETAALNETDLAEYCRRRGLLPEQIRAWQAACEEANDWERASTARMNQTSREERKRVQALERELARKENALAEAAALMILRKKPRRSGDRARTNDQHPRSPARRLADRRSHRRWGETVSHMPGTRPVGADVPPLANARRTEIGWTPICDTSRSCTSAVRGGTRGCSEHLP